MTIEILPARLANQIAAGEVVERPSSVVKELVENSLDAGATTIKIDIEKGGAKRIRISDNGAGIVKNELTLALSRHATSKIKDLNDLEGICSLGFRGEALASISSVARLTLTSKPAEQESAWQAIAEGRDMAVALQPAAHPNGTTIDVVDLFFNTPARRKFLRTEKTEFSHIEEVIKRIALARFDVSFILSHNQKVIKHFKAVNNKSLYAKRVAQICGQKFIEHSLEVDCHHGDLQLSGWVGLPSFARSQNDLCFSYVNGRMMRDKLINHAIRQAYSNMLPADTYPAFVLFLVLDVREVDVNVHPAKHEVRFHQGRYIHDFIYSVCHDALSENANVAEVPVQGNQSATLSHIQPEMSGVNYPQANQHESVHQVERDYIKPLTKVTDVHVQSYEHRPQNNQSSYTQSNNKVSRSAAQAYQTLMTPLSDKENTDERLKTVNDNQTLVLGDVVDKQYAVITLNNELRLLALNKLEQAVKLLDVQNRWQHNFVSQPLLLPIKISLDNNQVNFVEQQTDALKKIGIVASVLTKTSVQVREFPALLRNKDVNLSFNNLLKFLFLQDVQKLENSDWQQAFASLLTAGVYDSQEANNLLHLGEQKFNSTFEQQLRLNSVVVDLTSSIRKLTNAN
ncbi:MULTISPECIES: DNA mismatch repair endonuclease MutL [unclassified Colwellia]|uniref:DNA mismatch repair endonuclease MutL n=1 Tax=unclassified Colwellia TaxID=196834 RepID=UPI0015F3DDB1|nr:MULTISPECIES: DNA mismatch repair endonuclease MutL [unclassified Colwellia]MBA6256330.1 DNA mismatch repair endonuclease MutL [Colwellia sp. MB3u-28]MBA6260214.1 DNA mismatch repair endonuclease MutL [Colwellia sp. MB3u-41]MBA6301972.1 DNA mismatch repair endonuclease MutL [Colwellia sp. MB02u-14]